MKGQEIAPGVVVASQLTAGDVIAARAAGFSTIISNRPDGEEPGQPMAAELAATAEQQGIRFVHIPVSGGRFPAEAVRAMGEALATSAGPVLAYCRSGARSATIWALASAGRVAADSLIASARTAGVDLEPLRERLTRAADGTGA
jgi:sulfide:quinone oxidoreductase